MAVRWRCRSVRTALTTSIGHRAPQGHRPRRRSARPAPSTSRAARRGFGVDRVVPGPQPHEDAEPRGRPEVRPAGRRGRARRRGAAGAPSDRGPAARAPSTSARHAVRALPHRPAGQRGVDPVVEVGVPRAQVGQDAEGVERHDVVGRLELQEQLRALTTVDVRERAGVQVRRLLARLQRPQHVDQHLRGCVLAQRPPQTFEHVQPFRRPSSTRRSEVRARGAVIVPVSTHTHLGRHPGGGQPASRSSPAIGIGSHVGRLRDS